jgi:hypothetical protein
MIVDAERNALGFHEPRKLWQSRRRAMLDLMRAPAPPMPKAELLEQARRLEAIAEAHRSKTASNPES